MINFNKLYSEAKLLNKTFRVKNNFYTEDFRLTHDKFEKGEKVDRLGIYELPGNKYQIFFNKYRGYRIVNDLNELNEYLTTNTKKIRWLK